MSYSRISGFLALSLIFCGTTARAGYLFDSYQSNSADTAAKVISVEGLGEEQIEVRTLCRGDDQQLSACGEPIRVSRARVMELADAEQMQFDRLLASFERKPAPARKSENGLPNAAFASMALGVAFPPSAPVAIPLGALLGVVAAIDQASKKSEAPEAEPTFESQSHPKLGRLTARAIKKALTENVAISDYRKRDAIAMARANIEDLFSETTYAEIHAHLQRQVSQSQQKILATGDASAFLPANSSSTSNVESAR